jgi:hypothetical protein
MELQGPDIYRLTSGRVFYANNGIIGISPDGEVSEGYDGGIDVVREWDDEFTPWTPAERGELADEMIRRWQRFKGVRPS